MNDDHNRQYEAEERLPEPPAADSPGGFTWPIRRAYWFVEKHLLWPIADSFKRMSRGFRYRSPLAYIGATMLLTLTAAAIGAAVYFHNEAKDSEVPLAAQVPTDPETVIATTPTPPPTLPSTPANQAKDDDTLKGVVPNFENSSDKTGKADKSSTGDQNSSALPDTVVRPSDKPDSPPLKVAHNFAMTFVDYEIGKKGVAKDFDKTATAKLSKELKQDPPRQPSNGDIPKATVMNVVKGKKNGDTLDVSVSLMRSGATSELRLALQEGKRNTWLVSEVRG
ncbi:MAG TPA: hypothetical protein VMF31_11945 [Solirubrobacterales bacterium]|nr:hypothetical protein [Solirubrobacterales bacterium]